MYLNPILVKCFWCGETSSIAIPKRMSNKEEGYRECVINYDPCNKCKENWDKGAVIIEASTEPINERPAIAKGVYPTGVCWVVKRELLDDDISFVTKEIAKEMGLYDEVHE